MISKYAEKRFRITVGRFSDERPLITLERALKCIVICTGLIFITVNTCLVTVYLNVLAKLSMMHRVVRVEESVFEVYTS